jgi:tetratricopeptide (TPR) repeat protein
MSTDLDSIVAKADELYAKGLCDEAVALLSEMLSRHPARTDVAIRLSEFLVDSGRHAQALEAIGNDRSAQEDSRGLFLIGLCHQALGDSASAKIAADRLADEFSQTPDASSLKGKMALDALDDERAEQLFRAAIAEDAGCARAWHGLALLQKRRDDVEGFWVCARRAFSLMPASREIAIAFHESCLAAGTEEQAEADLREAIRAHPMNRRLRFLRIDLLLRQGRLSEAMAEIESSLVDFGVDEGLLGAALSVREKLGPVSMPAPAKSSGSVSLCMIVKNEKAHLARCLLSAKPLVDEIIVVDTGSSDETREIARVFGAQVHEIPWTNDFSKARNFSLSKASGDWILVLDADEVISESDHPEFRRLLANSPSAPVAYRIRTRNYSNRANTVGIVSNRGDYPEEEGIGWFPSDKVRLFKNHPRIRFQYPVHELVEPILHRLKIPVHDCVVVVHHYGTLNDIQAIEKTKSYQRLGQIKLKRNSRNVSALIEHAVQLAQLGYHAEAFKTWQKLIKIQPKSAEAYLNMGTSCWHLGKYGEAVSFADKALRLDPSLKEAKFNMAYSLLLLGKGGEAKAFWKGW